MSDTRILLAEDETITRMDLREMLENMGYVVVGEAADGIAAVNMVRTLKPDLIYLDTIGGLPLIECYDPRHPLTRSQAKEARLKFMREVTSTGDVLGDTATWVGVDGPAHTVAGVEVRRPDAQDVHRPQLRSDQAAPSWFSPQASATVGQGPHRFCRARSRAR